MDEIEIRVDRIGAEHGRKFSFTRKLNFPHSSLVCTPAEIQSHDQTYISRAIEKLKLNILAQSKLFLNVTISI